MFSSFLIIEDPHFLEVEITFNDTVLLLGQKRPYFINDLEYYSTELEVLASKPPVIGVPPNQEFCREYMVRELFLFFVSHPRIFSLSS